MDKDKGRPGGAAKAAIRGLLVSALSGPDSGLSDGEADALTDICLMGVSVRGDENPREMVRPVSDGILDRIVQNHEANRKNPVVGKVFQIFFVEWCHRRGHLECDWAWRWERPGEGKLFYKAKRPLEKVLLSVGPSSTPG